MKYKVPALLLILPLLAFYGFSSFLNVYYERYENIAKLLEKNYKFDESTANAIKHATAASDLYNLMRPHIGDERAEMAVIKLGVMNEYIERYTRRKTPDSVREIMKDLHNNYAGIRAAQLADGDDAFDIILTFASTRTLIVNEVYNPFFKAKGPNEDVVAFSYGWFKNHHGDIDTRFERKIARAKNLRDLTRIEISSLPVKSATIE